MSDDLSDAVALLRQMPTGIAERIAINTVLKSLLSPLDPSPNDIADEFARLSSFAIAGKLEGRGRRALLDLVTANAPLILAALRSSAGTFEEGVAQAARDVLAERERQKSVEGWTEAHDDDHTAGEMAAAAATYAFFSKLPASSRKELADFSYNPGLVNIARLIWPSEWTWRWWKPKDPRCDLVRAGALILAEIERLDRAAAEKRAP